MPTRSPAASSHSCAFRYVAELRELTGAAPSSAELMVECESGWPLVAHLWNILWAMTTAVAEAEAAAAGRSTSEDGSTPALQPDPEAAPDAAAVPVGAGFDYMTYACERWRRYQEERELCIQKAESFLANARDQAK